VYHSGDKGCGIQKDTHDLHVYLLVFPIVVLVCYEEKLIYIGYFIRSRINSGNVIIQLKKTVIPSIFQNAEPQDISKQFCQPFHTGV
jgi:hypothetical protein